VKTLKLEEQFTAEVMIEEASNIKDSDSIPKVIYPRIEATHAGLTKNKTYYQEEKLKGNPKKKSGVFSFINPYRKPVLTHHDHFGEPIGRVVNAEYSTSTKAGRPGIIITTEITDPEGIQKVLDKRYHTVSIGGETDSCTCSICGQDIINDGWCEHQKGKTYDNKECYWIIGDMWYYEVSFVNVPADPDAQVVDVGIDVIADSAIPPMATSMEDAMIAKGVKIEAIHEKVNQLYKEGKSIIDITEQWEQIFEDKEEETKYNLQQVEQAHKVLHYMWKHPKEFWPTPMIKEMHTRVAKQLKSFDHKHSYYDSLDATLPTSLK